MRFSALGDSALVLTLGDVVDDTILTRVQALAAAIGQKSLPGVVDVVPAFASVTVFYDPARHRYEQLQDEIEEAAQSQTLATTRQARVVEIPVGYGGELGPDLPAVAAHTGKAGAEVIALHGAADYRVHAIGFAPGFAYLAGLPPALHMPRRSTPRTQVPAGAVGIGGGQTGVYPFALPGGWNLIGRTAVAMFDATRTEPALLHVGDRVKFRAVPAAEIVPLMRETAIRSNARTVDRGGDATCAVTVVKAGMLTTMQDLGRTGYRASGVPLSGAADPFAARLANLLVGNDEQAAVLEFTLVGPMLRFAQEALVAVTGAACEGFPRWEPLHVAAGTTLAFGAAKQGCRGYLAVAGGWSVPPVLGSRSTYLRAGLGGVEGRALRDGDALEIAATARTSRGRWHIDERILPAYATQPVVRVVRGAQAEEFDETFYRDAYTVAAQSDRTGARLAGAALSRKTTRELASATVVPGTVQVPPDGQPIVLLADAQTIGGYPQIAHVITVDLPLVAQLRPGDAVRFREVSLTEAHRLARQREHALAMLREGLAGKFT